MRKNNDALGATSNAIPKELIDFFNRVMGLKGAEIFTLSVVERRLLLWLRNEGIWKQLRNLGS